MFNLPSYTDIIQFLGFNQDLASGVIAGLIATPIIYNFKSIVKYTIGRFLTFKSSFSISGIYDCEYHIPWKAKSVIYERIFIFKSFFDDKYYGFAIRNLENSETRAYIKPKHRLTGRLNEGRYFIGNWLEPDTKDRNCGAFMIEISDTPSVYNGVWSGKSTTYGKVLSGRWIWYPRLNLQEPGFLLKFLLHLFFTYKPFSCPFCKNWRNGISSVLIIFIPVFMAILLILAVLLGQLIL